MKKPNFQKKTFLRTDKNLNKTKLVFLQKIQLSTRNEPSGFVAPSMRLRETWKKLKLQTKSGYGNYADKNKQTENSPNEKAQNLYLKKKQVLTGFEPQAFAISSSWDTSTPVALNN